LLGLSAGDAVGTTVEFRPRGSFEPLTDMLGGGPFGLRPGSGYAAASLEAALWCFHTTSTFEAAVLEAANLGEDADTTAAIVGQVAGVFYGVRGIPERWLEKLHMREEIVVMADGLYERAAAR
jgi:ADP-ribosyl-[dinitrogen reductase] hydrolase